ncbi:MAG: alcohol dehydrogenase catalytic domain-containing protein, partial [Melioribacteraceae bacterium]|nr:alcohol dehydrogenase catalytic domain-containing protein [Melioribacteraceae bacterium]
MKKVVIKGQRQYAIEDVPTPFAIDDWALVKIIVAPMCTEYKAYISGDECDCLGHEAAGEVVEVAQPGDVEIGDRVVVMPQYPCGRCELCISGEYIHCENVIDIQEFTGSIEGNETYAQYILKPSWLLPKIPDHISFEHARMLCCGLGPTFGAMERMNVDSFDTILITGLGPVGLGGIINGIFRGARVICVSRNDYRSNLAVELGASNIIDPDDPDAVVKIKELTGGLGVD